MAKLFILVLAYSRLEHKIKFVRRALKYRTNNISPKQENFTDPLNLNSQRN